MNENNPNHKHIKVHEETHTTFKNEAKRKGKSLMDYMAALAKRVAAAAGTGAVLFSLVACTTPTSPEPCTKQEIHHGDTVTVPCVMHGGLGEP